MDFFNGKEYEEYKKNIGEIIADIYKQEVELDKELQEFNIYISSVMAYGYSEKEVQDFANANGIEIDESDYDIDDIEFFSDKNVVFGSLVVNKTVLKKVKGGK